MKFARLVTGFCDGELDAARMPRKARWLSGIERALVDLLDDVAGAVSKAA